jgi:hypothetical protein
MGASLQRWRYSRLEASELIISNRFVGTYLFGSKVARIHNKSFQYCVSTAKDNFLRQSRPTGSYYYPGAQLDGSLVPIIHRILPFANLDGIRNKLFFFTGFEYYNQSFEANQEAISGWVPTMSERQGAFSPAPLSTQLCGARPGKPTDNAFVESFNGTFRDECLNVHWFATLAEAKQLIEAWRQEYNESRPHRALNDRTPSEFASGYAASRVLTAT